MSERDYIVEQLAEQYNNFEIEIAVVARELRSLGYTETEIKKLTDYLESNQKSGG